MKEEEQNSSPNECQINRPVEEVFAFLSNFENNPKWQSSSIEAKKISEGPIGVGTLYGAVTTMLGRRINSEQTTIEYEPNKLVSRKSTSGPFPFEVHVKFEPVEGGTKINAAIMESRVVSSNWLNRFLKRRSRDILIAILQT